MESFKVAGWRSVLHVENFVSCTCHFKSVYIHCQKILKVLLVQDNMILVLFVFNQSYGSHEVRVLILESAFLAVQALQGPVCAVWTKRYPIY